MAPWPHESLCLSWVKWAEADWGFLNLFAESNEDEEEEADEAAALTPR